MIHENGITCALIEAIEAFPTKREVTHCGQTFRTSPFATYFECPQCRTRMKIRSFSASSEIEDVFDAVFAWMNRPGAVEIARQRQQQIADD
jgi:hypothetical protein